MVTAQGPGPQAEEKLIQMVNAHQTALLRLCYAYLHDQEAAKDAVQETFLKAYRGMNGYRKEASEKTWLSRIAVNVCRDQMKSAWFRRVNRSVTPDMLPESTAARTERDEELTVAVMTLPIKLRECILLYYFEDMNTVEIAQTLRISQQAVSSRLKRGREHLRAALEGRKRENG